jgi:hypothetical protein
VKKLSVEWSLIDVEASKIYSSPIRQLTGLEGNKSRAGVSVCPAVLNQLTTTFTVPAPFTFSLRFTGTIERPEVRLIESSSTITIDKFRQLFSLSPVSDWLTTGIPVFQVTTPYIFRSKESCHMLQKFPRALIGHGHPFRLIEGRFPIHKWIRPLSWAVEWVNSGHDIVVKRGDPWFDLQFFGNDLDTSFSLARRNYDEAFKDAVLSTRNITSYIKGTAKLLR